MNIVVELNSCMHQKSFKKYFYLKNTTVYINYKYMTKSRKI